MKKYERNAIVLDINNPRVRSTVLKMIKIPDEPTTEENEEQINTERWWFNRTSRLYFLSAENEPQEEYRGVLAAGGGEEEIYLSFGSNLRDGWTTDETVLFSPSTEAYHISSRQWKHTKNGMRFQDLDDSVAPHILYHKERFYTAPTMKKREFEEFPLTYLFCILRQLQLEHKERNGGI